MLLRLKFAQIVCLIATLALDIINAMNASHLMCGMKLCNLVLERKAAPLALIIIPLLNIVKVVKMRWQHAKLV